MSDARVVGALTLMSILIQLPYLDQGISLLDEGSILTIASELAGGDVLYRDQITFVAPLTTELVAALFRIFGESLVVGRLLQAVSFVATVLLGYGILRPVLGTSWAFGAALAVIALKPLGFPLYTIVNYSQLGMVLLLGALLCGLRFIATRTAAWLATAGLLCGLCLLAKQNLGVIAVSVVAAALLRDALGRSSLRALLRPATIFAVGASLPLIGAAISYAAVDALGDASRLVLVRAVEAHEDWAIPLPPLQPWSSRADAGALLYAYLPGTLADLQFQGRLQVGSVAAVFLEWAVKLAYVIPLAALSWMAIEALRARSAATPIEVVRASLLVGAALAFLSMLYRADWVHLTNIAPLLLVATALALAPYRWIRIPLLIGWLALALAAAGAMGLSRRETVSTPRGEITGLTHKADQLQRILRWSEALSSERSVAFLPAQPLLHFLTGRALPLSADLVVSWTIKQPEDMRLAEELAKVDLVVFDPHGVPWVGGALHDFAPRFAAVLADRFDPIEVVSPAAIVLARRPDDPGRRTITDLCAVLPGQPCRLWLGYRTIVPELSEAEPQSCLRNRIVPEPGHEFSVRPLFDPKVWAPDYRGIWFPEPAAARFEIVVKPPDGNEVLVHRETLEAGIPGPAVRVSLEKWAGQSVDLVLCVEIEPGESSFAPVGWAEPRISSSLDQAIGEKVAPGE